MGHFELKNDKMEYIVMAVCVVLAALIVVFAISQKKKGKFTSKMISHGAIAIAIACVLNLFPVFSMQNGGSITIARLAPLLIFAYIYGFAPGAVIGALYGVIDFIMKPYFINFFQFLLDYPLAFAGVAFAGLMFIRGSKSGIWSFIIGTVITGVSRWVFSTISGVVYWNVPFLGSLSYNSIVLIDTAICLVIVTLLFSSKSFLNFIDQQKILARQTDKQEA